MAAFDAAANVNAEPVALATAAIAVLVLTVRRRWPVSAFLPTLPALILAGAVLSTLIALYTVATQYRNRWTLTGCGVLAAGGYAFPELAFLFPGSDIVLGVLYATMTAAAPSSSANS